MTDLKPNLYTIKGGIGKCVAFTTLIKKLADRDQRKIAVTSGFPGVFKYHPNVSHCMVGLGPEAIEPVANQFDDIIMREPYISNYCKGDRHILDEWAKLYGLDPFPNGGFHARPELFVPPPLAENAQKIKEKLNKKFFIVQWTGGQPPQNLQREGKYPDNHLTRARNVKNYQDIMLALGEAFPEHLFLVYALPNEPVQMPESIRNRVFRAKAPSLAYASLLKDADSFVALDSSLQHFAAAEQVNKKGVVLWGHKTTPERIGYAFHTNLNSTNAEEVIVTPAQIVDALTKIVNSK